LANGAGVLNFLPERRKSRAKPGPFTSDAGHAVHGVRLTGTQVRLRDALLDALLSSAACVVLTGAAGLGKTTILAAALACIDDPGLHVLRLDGAEAGMDEAFRMLFPARPRPYLRQPRERRLILVIDQAEARLPGTFTYPELLNRMPGKAASIQWVIVGRSQPWDCLDAAAAAWLRAAEPVCLTLPALSEQDAWELFRIRVSPTNVLRPAARLVSTLLKQSSGLPGRFDTALKMAVAAGLLQGVTAQTAETSHH